VTGVERLIAIEAIKQVKARYFRGVDTDQADLVRGILAQDCELDYTGCFVDPATGTDYFPAMSVVMRGRSEWPDTSLAAFGIVSAHHGHNHEIEVTGDATASAIWSMTDRLFLPAGSPYARITGYGHYHETYSKVGDAWLIQTLRITRTRVEGD
jgi:hypothetical protein